MIRQRGLLKVSEMLNLVLVLVLNAISDHLHQKLVTGRTLWDCCETPVVGVTEKMLHKLLSIMTTALGQAPLTPL